MQEPQVLFDEKYFNQFYIDRARSLCHVLDALLIEGKISPETQKKVLVGLGTYFFSNIRQTQYMPPALSSDSKGESEWYLRLENSKKSPFVKFLKVLSGQNLDENMDVLVLNEIATHTLLSYSDIDFHLLSLQQNDIAVIQLSIEDTDIIKKIANTHSCTDREELLEAFKKIIFISEVNSEGALSVLYHQLHALYKQYKDFGNSSHSLLSFSEFVEKIKFFHINKKTTPYLLTYYNRNLTWDVKNELTEILSFITHNQTNDPASIVEFILSYEEKNNLDQKNDSLHKLYIILSILNQKGQVRKEIFNILKEQYHLKEETSIKLNEIDQKISIDNMIIIKKLDILTKKYELLSIYSDSIKNFIKEIDSENQLIANCLDSIDTLLDKMDHESVTLEIVYLLIRQIYEEIKLIAVTMQPNTYEKSPLLEESLMDHLKLTETMAFFYTPYAMQTMPCLFEIIASFNDPQVTYITNKHHYYETNSAIEAYDVISHKNINMIKLDIDEKKGINWLDDKISGSQSMLFFENKRVKLNPIDLKNIKHNGFILLDTTFKLSSKRIVSLVNAIHSERPDITIMTVASLNKFANKGINIASLGCVMVNKKSPFIELIQKKLQYLQSMLNPIYITWFEAIGSEKIKEYEKKCHQSAKKLYKALDVQKMESICTRQVDDRFLFSREFGFLEIIGKNEMGKLSYFVTLVNETLEDLKAGFQITPLTSFGFPISTYSIYYDQRDNKARLRISVGYLSDEQIEMLAYAVNYQYNRSFYEKMLVLVGDKIENKNDDYIEFLESKYDLLVIFSCPEEYHHELLYLLKKNIIEIFKKNNGFELFFEQFNESLKKDLIDVIGLEAIMEFKGLDSLFIEKIKKGNKPFFKLY